MTDRARILAALAEPILLRLPHGGVSDRPDEVAADTLAHVAAVPELLQFVIKELIDWLGDREAGQTRFVDLSPAQRELVIDTLVHDAASRDRMALLLRLVHLVIYSRPLPRSAIGYRQVDAPTVPPLTPVSVPAPTPADLGIEYDVCVVGSGAAGALVASRLAEQGKRVLLVEEGPWVSPADFAVRDDAGLRQSYRNAGLHMALPTMGSVLSGKRPSFLTIVQARVVGGGPAVNNAIHLPIAEEQVDRWAADHDFPFSWAEVRSKLDQVSRDLGVTQDLAERGVGDRSALFRDAANALGWNPKELPVSVLRCGGCGGCNLGCRFGRKTGGLHGPRGAEPRSYLERFLATPGPAVRANLRVKRFHGNFGGTRVTRASAEDLAAGGKQVEIKARHFVLAAGPIASSKILIRSGIGAPDYPTGTRIAANIVLPVYAILDRDLVTAPDPGLEMAVYVARENHLLESWFHYPGSLAPSVIGSVADHVGFMTRYSRMAAAGIVVPSEPNGQLGVTWDPVFKVTDVELGRLKTGIAELTELYLQAGAEEVVPATAFPSSVRRATAAVDLQRLLDQVRDPASLTLSTAHPQGGNRIGKEASPERPRSQFQTA